MACGSVPILTIFGLTGATASLVPVSVVPEKEYGGRGRRSAACPSGRPVYARIDGILRRGQFVLMEIEVIDPASLSRHGPRVGECAGGRHRGGNTS